MSLRQFDTRVDELLGRMSLAQKVGQVTQPERMHITPDEVREQDIGSVLSGGGSFPRSNLPPDWVEMNDAFWAASTESAMGIPVLYGVDAVHGHNNVRGATIFPHNIGLGAARDPDLIERIARITAREVLATGVEWTFAPTLAVVRDDHWGRTYESYSEDPEIVSMYSGAFVRGLQGDLGTDSVVACAKHWVGDGGTTGGVDQGETTVSEADLRRLHVAPYLPALRAGVLTVMASYNSWNDEKCHGHEYLLTDLLKGEFGFEGFVVSDWDGIDQVHDDYREAVALSINAGVDMFMVPEKWREFMAHLRAHVESGRVSMERLDDAVRRILRVKLAYGLFDRPRPAERPWSAHESYGSADHRQVAREAVRKSLVLLKHEGSVLPVDRGARILVAGKSAHDRGHQCGGFSLAWQGMSGNDHVEGGTSIWEGIQALAPGAVLSPDGGAAEEASTDEGDFDVAIVVIGERPYAEGAGDLRHSGPVARGSQASTVPGAGKMDPYGWTMEHAVSHPEDLAVIRRIQARGIPVVTVVVSGRPLVMNAEFEASSAVVAAWLPGSEGQGVADVLFGDFDFQGRLSFSWPREDGDTPNRGDDPDPSLYPYGFGLRLRG